jgi:hypothetical protein
MALISLTILAACGVGAVSDKIFVKMVIFLTGWVTGIDMGSRFDHLPTLLPPFGQISWAKAKLYIANPGNRGSFEREIANGHEIAA